MLVLIELWEQKIRSPLLLDGVPRRKLFRVALELLEAEQLGAQRRQVVAAPCRLDSLPVAAAPDGADGAAKASPAVVQASLSSLTSATLRLHNEVQSVEPQDASGFPSGLLGV